MKNGLPLLAVLALMALLIASPFLYLGAYYLMLRGRTMEVSFENGLDVWGAEKPLYRGGGEVVEKFFAVANAIDIHLRPDAWEKERRVPAEHQVHSTNVEGP
jgi:hypothetical protein